MSSNYNNNILVFILSAQCLGTFLLLKSAQNVPDFDYFYEGKKATCGTFICNSNGSDPDTDDPYETSV